jgi:hypothetical protein
LVCWLFARTPLPFVCSFLTSSCLTRFTGWLTLNSSSAVRQRRATITDFAPLLVRSRAGGGPLESSGYYMYHQAKHSQILRSAHTVYLCVLCGSENKQRLFHCTALTDWFL